MLNLSCETKINRTTKYHAYLHYHLPSKKAIEQTRNSMSLNFKKLVFLGHIDKI
jgi:hypothetical protein